MSLGAFSYAEDENGACEISYEDFGEYSGMDYEAIYKLDPVSRARLEKLLSEEYSGTLEEMIEEKFGTCLEKCSFCVYLNENGIRYELFTWCS